MPNWTDDEGNCYYGRGQGLFCNYCRVHHDEEGGERELLRDIVAIDNERLELQKNGIPPSSNGPMRDVYRRRLAAIEKARAYLKRNPGR